MCRQCDSKDLFFKLQRANVKKKDIWPNLGYKIVSAHIKNDNFGQIYITKMDQIPKFTKIALLNQTYTISSCIIIDRR